jgi:hypothetical protein
MDDTDGLNLPIEIAEAKRDTELLIERLQVLTQQVASYVLENGLECPFRLDTDTPHGRPRTLRCRLAR